MQRMVAPGVAAAGLVVGLLLAGCGSTPPDAGPTSVPSASATVSPTPPPTAADEDESTPEPTPDAPLALPSCDALIPLATVREFYGENAEPHAIDMTAAEIMSGPASAAATASAEATVLCSWAIPYSEAGFWVFAADLDDAPRDTLIAALRAEPSYIESTSDGAPVFTMSEAGPVVWWSHLHLFDGDLWIAVVGAASPDLAATIASHARAGVLAAQG